MKTSTLKDEIARTIVRLSLDAWLKPFEKRIFVVKTKNMGVPPAHSMAGLVRVCPELPLLGLLLINEDNPLIVPVRPEDA